MNNRLSTVEMREAFFFALYKKSFPKVARYVARMGGNLDEAQDIFQDALVIYYEKVTSPRSEAVINEKGYLLGIAKKLWLQHYRAECKIRSLDNLDTADLINEQPSTVKLMKYLATAGTKCMELLKAYYYDNVTVSDAVTWFGYSSAHSATVAKYKCLEKVRETIKQNSLKYADFIE